MFYLRPPWQLISAWMEMWNGREIEHVKCSLKSFNMEVCTDTEMVRPVLPTGLLPAGLGVDPARWSAAPLMHLVPYYWEAERSPSDAQSVSLP